VCVTGIISELLRSDILFADAKEISATPAFLMARSRALNFVWPWCSLAEATALLELYVGICGREIANNAE